MCRSSSSVSSEWSPSASPTASALASPAWKVTASPLKTSFTSAGSAMYTTRPKIGKRDEKTSP